jgi:hypothetical protein
VIHSERPSTSFQPDCTVDDAQLETSEIVGRILSLSASALNECLSQLGGRLTIRGLDGSTCVSLGL